MFLETFVSGRGGPMSFWRWGIALFLGWMLAGPLFAAAFRLLGLQYRVRPSLPVDPRLREHRQAPIAAPERRRPGRAREALPKPELARVRIRRPKPAAMDVTVEWWMSMVGDARDSSEAMGD
jgi:hypothetical protein